jgi:hypothetical protein
MQRSTKRQRLEYPLSWMDCDSIEAVVLVQGPKLFADNKSTLSSLSSNVHSRKNSNDDMIIRTPMASPNVGELFLERFQIEIVNRFRYTLSSQIRLLHENDSIEAIKKYRSVLKKRVLVGINACTRHFEWCLKVMETDCNNMKSSPLEERPLLLVLATDVMPPTIMAHLPVLANRFSPPIQIFLLPGKSSSIDLGKILGTKKVAALLFTSQRNIFVDDELKMNDDRVHRAVDSFVEFMLQKLGGQKIY